MKLTNINVYGLADSIIASGYPMTSNSFDLKSDNIDTRIKRAIKLGNSKSGYGHDSFLKGIVVQGDLQCSQNMHMQLLRYHFFEIVSSMSKMHRLLNIDIKKYVNEYVSEDSIFNIMQEIDYYNEEPTTENYLRVIYNCPMGLELTFCFTTNYLQLKTIYKQRHNHRLIEWKEFCIELLDLPMFSDLTGLVKEKEESI